MNAIIICSGSFLSILVCWIAGKYRDKKIINVGGSFSDRHPRLNMIVGLALVVIIGTICFVVAYYTFLYLGRKINALVDWVSNMASKMDAVVIVAFITGTVSIVNILVCGNLYSGNVETDIPVAGNRLISAWLIVPCIDVICPALAA